jgi:hypothetical protein
MNVWQAAYQFMRILKVLLWASFFGFGLYFVIFPERHLDQFNHIVIGSELAMFGLPLAAVAAGLFQMMFRDKVTPHAERLPQR